MLHQERWLVTVRLCGAGRPGLNWLSLPLVFRAGMAALAQ
jgi:hypothetical protein